MQTLPRSSQPSTSSDTPEGLSVSGSSILQEFDAFKFHHSYTMSVYLEHEATTTS